MSKKTDKYISKHAKKNAKKLKISLHDDKTTYSKQQYVQIYKGYDAWENVLLVRAYIQKHYDIDWSCLELLLKLMGMRVFTIKDYHELPRSFTYARFATVRERGYVQLVQDSNFAERQIYTLSTKYKNACVNFYKMLAGEKPIPEEVHNNIMARKIGQRTIDKKRMELIKKLNQLPTKEHFKKLYE